jgi:hypothetical protein
MRGEQGSGRCDARQCEANLRCGAGLSKSARARTTKTHQGGSVRQHGALASMVRWRAWCDAAMRDGSAMRSVRCGAGRSAHVRRCVEVRVRASAAGAGFGNSQGVHEKWGHGQPTSSCVHFPKKERQTSRRRCGSLEVRPPLALAPGSSAMSLVAVASHDAACPHALPANNPSLRRHHRDQVSVVSPPRTSRHPSPSLVTTGDRSREGVMRRVTLRGHAGSRSPHCYAPALRSPPSLRARSSQRT